MGAMANNSTAADVGWEEVVATNERGRREVYYYLKRSDGGRNLVVVGKEKSNRHMSYNYAFEENNMLPYNLNRASRLKLRSRRDVVDWLNSLLSGERPSGSVKEFTGGMDGQLDDVIVKDVRVRKMDQYANDFMWLGSSWTCRKRRRHYGAFCRNGAVISAQEFVFVLAEEGKRLVAYLDDMYEDVRGNKMVVVRWFHKIDEVGFVLPPDYNDREIFFSLCLQDLSIECIDGLATVLSPDHYEKYFDEATHIGLNPFVCYRQFDNDDVKPFDITRIKGYWKQKILSKTTSSLELSEDGSKSKGSLCVATGLRPNKRIRCSKESDFQSKPLDKRVTFETSLQVCNDTSIDSKGGWPNVSVSGQNNSAPSNPQQYLNIGSQVEILSQDSGIRGCWFSASIIKKHKEKVKVQYKDVKDAVDDSKYLEEWILASRVAAADALEVRLSGRTIVRPTTSYDEKVSDVLNVGCVVDAWWHDGWWEGIIVNKESEDRLKVYFPGEKQELLFNRGNLRRSKEWFNGEWHRIKGRPDIVSSLSGINKKSDFAGPIHEDSLPVKTIKIRNSTVDSKDKNMPNESRLVPDLSKDYSLVNLRWNSSGKRRRGRSPVHKGHYGSNNTHCAEAGLKNFEKFLVNSSLKFDTDNCKYANEARFSSSTVNSLTNLVMSR
ncbi:hypothetical protein ABFS82_12G078900 [Erythranthe guttata]